MTELQRTHQRPMASRRFTVATLVTDPAQYEAMQKSFIDFGFEDAEFLKIDNTGAHQTCAYRGLNHLLNEATGDIVILCHQDVRLFDHDRNDLERCLDDLEARDAHWAVAGNAGGVAPGQLALRITDPHGVDRRIGDLPARVMSLDENFLVVRRSARIGFSNDLTGFHFYGTDICLMADVAGLTSYVIDFHLAHLSPGKKDASFSETEAAFREKWGHALSARWIQTTCSLFYVSGTPLTQRASAWVQRPFAKLTKQLPRASGWS